MFFEIGYSRPPRQQNGTNTSNHDGTNNGKAWSTNNTNKIFKDYYIKY